MAGITEVCTAPNFLLILFTHTHTQSEKLTCCLFQLEKDHPSMARSCRDSGSSSTWATGPQELASMQSTKNLLLKHKQSLRENFPAGRGRLSLYNAPREGEGLVLSGPVRHRVTGCAPWAQAYESAPGFMLLHVPGQEMGGLTPMWYTVPIILTRPPHPARMSQRLG